MRKFSISTSMNTNPWTTDPEQAYADWQKEEAAGADRRPFAEQSIVQHRTMFARFHRYLAGHRQTVATFGVDHVDGFFQEISADCDLPLEAVREAIAYCQSDPPEIKEDFEREERLMEATGMNDPDYKYGGKFKQVPLEELARILNS